MAHTTSIAQGRLDRLERMLNDLLTNREEMLDVLGLVRRSLETKLGEVKQLDRIEHDLAEIRGVLGMAAGQRATGTEQPKSARRLTVVKGQAMAEEAGR